MNINQKVFKAVKPHIVALEDRKNLKTQNSDNLDFMDIAVWELQEALKIVYELGRKDGQDEREN